MCNGSKYGTYTVIFGAPAFLGVVSAWAWNWYQATFFYPPAGPVAWVYEANHTEPWHQLMNIHANVDI